MERFCVGAGTATVKLRRRSLGALLWSRTSAQVNPRPIALFRCTDPMSGPVRQEDLHRSALHNTFLTDKTTARPFPSLCWT
jgi:hypothetical protein